jgi:threonine aldolase
MEAGLLVPSGVCGNQCAIAAHTRPGDEVIVSETSHVVDHETGAAAALAGVQLRTVEPRTAHWITAAEIEPRIRTIPDIHHPDTGLIVLENALALGSVMPIAEMNEVRVLAAEHGIPIHLDGARLFNAAVALGVEASAIAAHVDSVTFCLSKGLSAPVGSVLCGTADFVERARRERKKRGGGMRQAGIIAAPGIVALEQATERIHADHANARRLAERLALFPQIEIEPEKVHINMVFCRVRSERHSNEGLVKHLAKSGIRTYEPGWWGLRFVTSSRVTRDDVETLIDAVADYLS